MRNTPQLTSRPARAGSNYRLPKSTVTALRAVTGGTHGVAEFNDLADQLGKTETRYLGSAYPSALAHYHQPELFPTVAPETQWEEIVTWGGVVAEVATFATGTEYNPALRAHAANVTGLAARNWVEGQAAFQAAVKARDGVSPYPEVTLETTLGTVAWRAEAPNTFAWQDGNPAEVWREIRDLTTTVG